MDQLVVIEFYYRGLMKPTFDSNLIKNIAV